MLVGACVLGAALLAMWMIAAALFGPSGELGETARTEPPAALPGVHPWETPLAASPRLLIRYEDFEGNVTNREITPHVLAGKAANRPDRVLAYCHRAKAARTFVLGRIEQAADASTGELIPNVRAHLKARAIIRH